MDMRECFSVHFLFNKGSTRVNRGNINMVIRSFFCPFLFNKGSTRVNKGNINMDMRSYF